jgi:hypothetical protein
LSQQIACVCHDLIRLAGSGADHRCDPLPRLRRASLVRPFGALAECASEETEGANTLRYETVLACAGRAACFASFDASHGFI